MGAEAGHIALYSGIACGAEAIIMPEIKGEMRDITKMIETGNKRKNQAISSLLLRAMKRVAP